MPSHAWACRPGLLRAHACAGFAPGPNPTLSRQGGRRSGGDNPQPSGQYGLGIYPTRRRYLSDSSRRDIIRVQVVLSTKRRRARLGNLEVGDSPTGQLFGAAHGQAASPQESARSPFRHDLRGRSMMGFLPVPVCGSLGATAKGGRGHGYQRIRCVAGGILGYPEGSRRHTSVAPPRNSPPSPRNLAADLGAASEHGGVHVRLQERETADLLLSDLYEWQRALDVPVSRVAGRIGRSALAPDPEAGPIGPRHEDGPGDLLEAKQVRDWPHGRDDDRTVGPAHARVGGSRAMACRGTSPPPR